MVDSVLKEEFSSVERKSFTIRKDQIVWLNEKAKEDDGFNKSKFLRELIDIAMTNDEVDRPDHVFMAEDEQTGITSFIKSR